MIQFNFKGQSTLQEREQTEIDFLKFLGPFKQEFDDGRGIVTINFNVPPEDENRYRFVFEDGKPDILIDFIRRFKTYQEEKK